MNTWTCPVCGSNAYQRYGGISVPAKRITLDEKTGKEVEQRTSVRMNTHFMCKGCSLFFSNPNLFNKENVDERRKK